MNDSQRKVLEATIVFAGVPIAVHLFIPGTSVYLAFAVLVAVIGAAAYIWLGRKE